MNNLINIKMDVRIIIICSLYAGINGFLSGLGLGSFEQVFYGLLVGILTCIAYYAYEAVYSKILYRLKNEWVRFTIGLVITIGYFLFLGIVLFAGTTFTQFITDIDLINEGLVNLTIILSIMAIIGVVSILYGHSLGESLYRLSFMYVAAIGNGMIFFYYNPFDLDKYPIMVALNVILIFMTLRQIVRSRGLLVVREPVKALNQNGEESTRKSHLKR